MIVIIFIVLWISAGAWVLWDSWTRHKKIMATLDKCLDIVEEINQLIKEQVKG